MEEFIRSVTENIRNPYVKAAGVFLLSLLAILGLASLASDTGFGQEITERRNLVWLTAVGVAFVISIFWFLLNRRKDKRQVFRIEPSTGIRFLMDLNNRLRKIPDEDTYTFLLDSLGASDNAIELSEEDIELHKGSHIVPIDDCERPLDPHEQAEKELHRRVSRNIRLHNVTFDSDSDPQKIVVDIINEGQQLVLKEILFFPYEMQRDDISAAYQRQGIYIRIPFDRNSPTIAQGEHRIIQIELQSRWQPEMFNRRRGRLGSLNLDVGVGNDVVRKVLVTL